MGKVVIDAQMVGINIMQVIYREAMAIAKEKGMDAVLIEKELTEAPTQQDFAEVIEKYFSGELIIYW